MYSLNLSILKYLTSTLNTSPIEKNNQSEQSSGKRKKKLLLEFVSDPSRKKKKKKKGPTCFADLSLREPLTASAGTRRAPGQPPGGKGARELPGPAPFVPADRCRRVARPSRSPPPGPAPRSGPDRRVSTAGRGLRRCSRPPARAHTKAREPAEEERPRLPPARPYPAAPPPAAPAAVPDRRAPPRGRHGCC